MIVWFWIRSIKKTRKTKHLYQQLHSRTLTQPTNLIKHINNFPHIFHSWILIQPQNNQKPKCPSPQTRLSRVKIPQNWNQLYHNQLLNISIKNDLGLSSELLMVVCFVRTDGGRWGKEESDEAGWVRRTQRRWQLSQQQQRQPQGDKNFISDFLTVLFRYGMDGESNGGRERNGGGGREKWQWWKKYWFFLLYGFDLWFWVSGLMRFD